MYTLKQAAKASRKSKSTIHRAATKGIITATKNEQGQWQIDPAELHRVFPAVPEEQTISIPLTQTETGRNDSETQALEVEIEYLRKSLANMEKDRDAWQEMAQRLALSPPEQQDNHKENKGFWYHMKAAFAGAKG